MALRSTSVVVAAVGHLDENGGAGVFITVKDTDTGTPSTPSGTVTITASKTSGGASVFNSYNKTIDKNGQVYTWVHSENPTDRIPLTFYGNVANWYIQVVYNGDATHAASASVEAIVPNTSFNEGE